MRAAPCRDPEVEGSRVASARLRTTLKRTIESASLRVASPKMMSCSSGGARDPRRIASVATGSVGEIRVAKSSA